MADLQGVRRPLRLRTEVFRESFSTLHFFNTWYVGSALPLKSRVPFPGAIETSEAHRDPKRDAIMPTSPLSTGQDSLGLHTALSEKQHQFCLHVGSRLQNSAPRAGGLAGVPLLQASPMTWRGLLEVPPKNMASEKTQMLHAPKAKAPPSLPLKLLLAKPWSEVEGRLSESSRQEVSGSWGEVLQLGYLAPFVLLFQNNKKNSS